MDNKLSFIKSFTSEAFNEEYITGSASKRKYSRLYFASKTLILCESDNIKETEDFLYLTKELKAKSINVPNVIKLSKNKRFYLLEDLGSISLLQLRLEAKNCTNLYRSVIKQLVSLQSGLNSPKIFNNLNGYKRLDEVLIYRDLFYFKHYFLDLTENSYNEVLLLNEFNTIKEQICKIVHKGFMYRDLQGRNVMIYNQEPYFIDYQGGMQGPVVYDLISLIWQAKASLNLADKSLLKDYYLDEWNASGHKTYTSIQFNKDYDICLLFRLLQVLGAYGRLGILQNKEHFKTSIQFGINNLKEIVSREDFQFLEIKNIANSLNYSL